MATCLAGCSTTGTHGDSDVARNLVYAAGYSHNDIANAEVQNTRALPEEIVKAVSAAKSISLYSIQPWGGPDLDEWNLHGHHILGHVELQQTKAQTAIAALYKAVSEGSAALPMCLVTPRHAIRVVSGDVTYDILICYQCGQLDLFKNDERLPFMGSIGRNSAILNSLLKSAGIPLADNQLSLNRSYVKEAHVAMQRANAGNRKAQELIGQFLLIGRGTKKNVNRGIEWLAKSYGTTADNPEFEVAVGKMLDGGLGSKPDYEGAMKLFRDAAEHGDAEGQYQLGIYYDLGRVVKRDAGEALKWFQRAADQGNPKAQHQVGLHFANSRDGKEDYPESMKWFQKAAVQGHPEAMSWIGALYERGWGVDKDLEEAYFWRLLSRAYHAYDSGRDDFAITAEQKAAAENRVAVWKLSHPLCANNCHD